MDVITIEREKARAQEAFAKGQLQEASRTWELLEAEYLRFGALDGVIALRFNRLLAAVEADERALMPRLAGALAEALQSVEAPASATVVQVASGVLRLLQGGPRGALGDAEERLGRAALQFAQTPGVVPAEAFPSTGFADVPTAALVHLEAPDAARILLSAPGSIWAALLGAADAGALLANELTGALEALRVTADTTDACDLYVVLVNAFERARPTLPALASELQIGLLELEAAGLPDRLDYVPGLPLERRLRASLELHGDLANALSGVAGFERAARRQWRSVVGLAQRVVERIQVRQLRGSGNADDALVDASAALWRSLALRHLGQIGPAREALGPCVSRAQRCAYSNLLTSVRVLVAAAELDERQGHRERAARLFDEAAELALPGIGHCAEALGLAELIGESIADGATERLPWVSRALCGSARTRAESDPTLARFNAALARDLLSLSRVYVPLAAHQGALLWAELSLASLGDVSAATRATELSHIRRQPLALAVAQLLGAPKPSAMTLRLAASDAARGAAGAIRRYTEGAAAMACLAASSEAGRLDVHLRRFIEASQPTAFADAAGEFDVFLPRDGGFSMSESLDRLLADGRTEFVWQLCALERRRPASPEEDPTTLESVATAIRTWHRVEFERRRRGGLAALEPPAELHARLTAAAKRDAEPHAALDPAQAVLAFRVTDEGSLVLMRHGSLGAPVVRRLAIQAPELGAQVARFRALMAAGDDPRRELLAQAQSLYEVLIRPQAAALEAVTALLIIADGTLDDLPFSALLGDVFLCERFDLSIERPSPSCRPSSPAPPAVAVIAGDQATTRDLRLSTLAREGLYEAVSVRMGEALGPDRLRESMGPARFVHLVGTLEPGRGLCLVEDEAPTSAPVMAAAFRDAGVTAALVFGPVEGDTGRSTIDTLLSGVSGGIFARHWEADEDGEFLLELARASAVAETPSALAAALAATRRAAIRAKRPASLWAAYELYVGERE